MSVIRVRQPGSGMALVGLRRLSACVFRITAAS